MMAKVSYRDRYMGIGFLITSILIYGYTYTFPTYGLGMEPQFFPRLLAGLFGFVSLFLIFRPAYPLGEDDEFSKAGSKERWMIFISFLILSAYFFLLPVFGYIITTVTYMVIMMWYLGEQVWWRIVGWSLGVTLLIYGVFKTLLNVPLPGFWFN